MEEIKINDKLTAIIERNLEEKSEKEIIEFKSCEECKFYNNPWIWGAPLHCCAHNHEKPKTSRDINELFDTCPIDGKIEIIKNYIKQYGIIHEKDNYYDNNYIAIVDFSSSHWEADGHNPDIDWSNVAVFYYRKKEDEEKMMKLVLDYYYRFDFDKQFTKKRCYG